MISNIRRSTDVCSPRVICFRGPLVAHTEFGIRFGERSPRLVKLIRDVYILLVNTVTTPRIQDQISNYCLNNYEENHSLSDTDNYCSP